MIEDYKINWFIEQWIKLRKKYSSEIWQCDILCRDIYNFESLEDGYNAKFKNENILILDDYGDEEKDDNINSICLVDSKLDCCIIDMDYDYNHTIHKYYNKIKTNFPIVKGIIGGKRAYDYNRDTKEMYLKFLIKNEDMKKYFK